MSTGFKIDFAWIPRDFGDAVERLSLAGITIEAGGVTVTEVEDSEARTTRPEIHVSAFDLASWLVANWWRLRWEADGDGLSWKWRTRPFALACRRCSSGTLSSIMVWHVAGRGHFALSEVGES